MRLLILSTTPFRSDGSLLKQRRLWMPGLGPPLLAALTPDDFEVRIVNETVQEIPFEETWDLVALTAMGPGIVRAWQLGDEFRRRGTPVVIGGVMASLAPEHCLDHCDSVVVGEAEGVWPRVLSDFRKGSIEKVYRNEEMADLAELPLPRFDLLDRKKLGWWLPVQAGRGCPYRCTFCSVASFFKNTYRRRPIDQVIRDVEHVKSLGYRKVLILDDNIGADPAFARTLFKELVPQKITWMTQCALSIARHPDLLDLAAESGCVMMSFGLETLSNEGLDSVGKTFTRVEEYGRAIRSIRGAGIDVCTEMVFGFDADDAGVFARTLRFILEHRITVPRFHILTPIPGTRLYDEWEREGRLATRDWTRYTGSEVVFTPRGMTAEELARGYWMVYERLFTFPGIFRRFWSRLRLRSLPISAFLLGVNFHYRSHIRQGICPGIV